MLIGLQVLAFGAGLLGLAWALRRADAWTSRAAGLGGLVALALGAYLAVPAAAPIEPVRPVAPREVAAVPEPPGVMARPIPAGSGTTAARAELDGRAATVRLSPARFERGVRNRVEIELVGDAPTDPPRYEFSMVGHLMPEDAGIAVPSGPGRYEIPPAIRFDMVGDWRLDLNVGGDRLTYWLYVDADGAIAFVPP